MTDKSISELLDGLAENKDGMERTYILDIKDKVEDLEVRSEVKDEIIASMQGRIDDLEKTVVAQGIIIKLGGANE